VLLPESATPLAARLVAARALRGFADGFTSVFLAAYLSALGFSPFQIGALATATLLGSAALTLAVGLLAHRLPPRFVLLGASALMLATGAGFAGLSEFWPLLLLAFAGTLNPSSGDVSVFLPTEQALLAESVSDRHRTAIFARYNVAGALLGALGALASGLPELAARRFGLELSDALRAGFWLYGALALPIALLYWTAPRGALAAGSPARPLARSRRIVLQLTALFSLDSFGGGFAVQTLLALWLFQRFDLSLQAAGSFFFAAALLAGFSQLVSARLADRIGLVRTMVYTHLPANVFLMLAALMPDAPLALTCLLLRAALSQMDVPARQSLVMAVVPVEERAAAASVTNVPRSLATALAPLLAGALLSRSSFGWPLLVGGALKIAYDLLLLARFRTLGPGGAGPRPPAG
jgi:MFS family permease